MSEHKNITCWQNDIDSLELSSNTKYWLTKKHLSHAIKKHFAKTKLALISQCWQDVNPYEKALLNLMPQDKSLVLTRQVVLHSNKQPCLYAHSLFSKACYFTHQYILDNLNTNTLETVLYNLHVPSSDFQYTKLCKENQLYKNIRFICPNLKLDSTLWARRSLYNWDGCHLVIIEVLLPSLINVNI